MTKTCCNKCAKKYKLKEACDESDHRVLVDQGVDATCDFCGKENGGAVIEIKGVKTF